MSKQDMGNKTVQEILLEAADFFTEKNKGYGDAYKKQPQILFAILGEITLKDADDYSRLLRIAAVITKISRFAKSFKEKGHLDSAKDLVVFSAMLQEIAEIELGEKE